MKVYEENLRGTSIGTVSGEAFYFCTEIEEEGGEWDDGYWVNDGFWVIHDGTHHRVYKVKKT